jgi:hypothetical protein
MPTSAAAFDATWRMPSAMWLPLQSTAATSLGQPHGDKSYPELSHPHPLQAAAGRC